MSAGGLTDDSEAVWVKPVETSLSHFAVRVESLDDVVARLAEAGAPRGRSARRDPRSAPPT